MPHDWSRRFFVPLELRALIELGHLHCCLSRVEHKAEAPDISTLSYKLSLMLSCMIGLQLFFDLSCVETRLTMADTPQLEDHLRPIRQQFESTRMDLGDAESVKDVFSSMPIMGMSYACNHTILLISQDAKKLIIDLILALQNHLHIHTTKDDRQTQLANLARIESSVFADSFDTELAIPLVEQVVNCGSEERIYSAVSDLAPRLFVTSPTPSFEVVSDTQTSASSKSSATNSPRSDHEQEYIPAKRAKVEHGDLQREEDGSGVRERYDTGAPSADGCLEGIALKPPILQYQPLDTTRREIRLLVLYPDTNIFSSCRLIHVSMEENLDYEALSYVWGSQADNKQTSINGQQLSVTANLKEALDHLRHSNRPRILWIDAICINQGSILERNQQVQMMTEIYEKARNVVVWIGVLGFATQQLLNRLDELEDDHQTPKRSGRWSISGSRIKFDSSGMTVEDKRLLSELAQNPWFTRVWVIQEVAVAREVVVQTGHTTICWEAFGAALERCSNNHEMNSVIEAVRTINTIRYARSQKPYYMDLFVLLERFRHCLATDERDKVFALLGLTSSSLLQEKVVQVIPDYQKPAVEIYRSLTRNYINSRKNLDILCHASLPNHRPIPSWVPIWSYHNPGLSVLPKRRISGTRYEPMYRCCGDLEVDRDLLFGPELSHNRLWLNGLRFDVVTIVGSVATNTQALRLRPSVESVTDLLQEWRSMSEICSHVYGANLESAFQRTLVADASGERRGQVDFYSDDIGMKRGGTDLSSGNPDFVYLIEGRLGAVENEQTLLEERSNIGVDHREANIKRAAIKRSFFVTEKGYMGLGPFNMEEGDLVYVLAGGQVPFILRPEVSPDGFWLVGESYVHGIMDGEATMLGIEVETIYLV
jgi:hypothetical protein